MCSSPPKKKYVSCWGTFLEKQQQGEMSELFAPGGNFSLLIRIVACVRGEQRWGPVQANSAPNEECLVNVWSSLQMAKFLPNNIRTPDGMLGSRTRMASTLVHVRDWLLSACNPAAALGQFAFRL